jgi:hypothetical protein
MAFRGRQLNLPQVGTPRLIWNALSSARLPKLVDHATFKMTRAAVLVASYAVEHSQTVYDVDGGTACDKSFDQ